MPVILDQQDWPTWLGEAEGDCAALLRLAPHGAAARVAGRSSRWLAAEQWTGAVGSYRRIVQQHWWFGFDGARLWQGVGRGISVGRHIVRRWNPCPDPDRQVADDEQRRWGLEPRTGRNRLTTERGSNPLSRIHNSRLGMRGCRQ
jgi:hypothetical protein